MSSLTHAQVLKMEAGPELNALIAERVMGWTLTNDWEMPYDEMERGAVSTDVDSKHLLWSSGIRSGDWSPSTDIAAAMTVLGKWADPERHGGYGEGGIFWEGSRNDWTWCCKLGVVAKAHAPTPQLAICRAALLTTLEKKES